MRLTAEQTERIRRAVRQIAGESATVSLFGSRLDDAAKGGDIDLLVSVPYPVSNPATLVARLVARVSVLLGGRDVDVLLSAPNLERQPIHDIAREEGQLL